MINSEEQKVKENLKDYLIDKGIDISRKFRCPNPEHNDKDPSAMYYSDSNTVYCYGCGQHYDLINLIAFDYCLNNKEAYKKAFEMFGNKTAFKIEKQEKINIEKREINFYEKFIIWHNALLTCDKAKNYLYSRGISDNTINKFNLGYKEKEEFVVFPTSQYSYNSRSINQKQFFKEGKSTIFNQSALNETKNYCIITESEIDCLSFLEVGYNAIGLGGVSIYKKLLEQDLSKEKVYILALDNDEVGQKTTNELIYQFKQRELRFLVMNYGELNKDPNEALTSNLAMFKRDCEETINKLDMLINEEKEKVLKEYDSSNSLNAMTMFDEYVEKTKSFTPYATGFKQLDEYLDGGLREGLTTLLAIPGIGKTTLTLQIADNVAKSGKDVLIFALEMSRNELIAKSLSRISYETETRRGGSFLDTNTFLLGYKQINLQLEKLDYIEKCKDEYKKYAEHIYINESNTNTTIISIKNRIKQHIEITKNIPLVIIDYAQIISPIKDNMTDKQNLDNTVLELKRITRDLGVAVLCISSVNRNSYAESVSLSSAKESGGIEFTSTVLIGLQYKGTKNKDGKLSINLEEQGQKEVKDIELKIIKNRFGKAYKTVNMKFYSEFNYFQEDSYQLSKSVF